MPNRILKESICTSERINSLSDFNFRLWACLITYVDDFGRGDARSAIIKGRCFPLRERVTVRDIDAGLHALADAGCILLYTVDGDSYLCFPNWNKHQTVRNQKSKYPAPPACDSGSLDSASNCKQLQANVPVIQSESNPNPNPNPTRARGAAVPPGFDRFWEVYPRKEAKQDAIRAFEKLNPSAMLIETMVKAVQEQKQSSQWQEDGGKYIPHPATWINGKRWEDHLQQAKEKTGKRVNAQNYTQREYTEEELAGDAGEELLRMAAGQS